MGSKALGEDYAPRCNNETSLGNDPCCFEKKAFVIEPGVPTTITRPEEKKATWATYAIQVSESSMGTLLRKLGQKTTQDRPKVDGTTSDSLLVRQGATSMIFVNEARI